MAGPHRIFCFLAASLGVIQPGICSAGVDVAPASVLWNRDAAIETVKPGRTALQPLRRPAVLGRPAPVAQAGPPSQARPAAGPDEQAHRALLHALMDARAAVRAQAAKTLASASDEAALSVIETGIESGLFSESEAVNYFGLADIKVGGPYLLRRLARGSPGVKALAVQYLGTSPAYRLLVRDKVFLSSAADPLSRAAAATVLSQYDPAFGTYALIVTLDPNLPEQVFANTLRGYVSQTMAQGKLDASRRFLLREAILNYEKKLGNGQPLKILDETLKLIEF